MRRFLFLLLFLAAALALLASPTIAQTQAKPVDLIQISGLIDPPTADYLKQGLEAANPDDIQAVIIQLDTSGGVGVSDATLRSFLPTPTATHLPLIVWIAPRGSEARGLGTAIANSADLVFAAPETRLDPAIETDGAAASLGELLQRLDAQGVSAGPGPIVATLETWDEARGAPSVTVRFEQMDLLPRLQHAIISPEIAFLLLLLGMFGLIFEVYNPGIGLAAILGAAALAMSFYGFSVLPTNWLGVLIVVAGVCALLYDLHTGGFGVWTGAGLVALIAGGALLFRGAPARVSLSPWAIVAAVALSLVFFISVMTAALRVRLRRPITDEEGVVGSIAEAKTDIAPEGTVLTKGTLWRARTMETGIAAGSKVEVKATEGLVLLVEPLHEADGEA